MVGVVSGSLYRRTHSLSRLAWSWVGGGLAPFYIHQMNPVNSHNGSAMMTGWQHHKHCRDYYYYYYPSSVFSLPNVTAHPSTASVPITVLLYNGPLLCGFNMPIKGLKLHILDSETSSSTVILSIVAHFLSSVYSRCWASSCCTLVISLCHEVCPVFLYRAAQKSETTVIADVFKSQKNVQSKSGLAFLGHPVHDWWLLSAGLLCFSSLMTLLLCLLFLFIVYSNVSKHIVAGNHESETMNQMYGFDGEVKSKYPLLWVSLSCDNMLFFMCIYLCSDIYAQA